MSGSASRFPRPWARRELLQWGTAAAVGTPWANRLWAQTGAAGIAPFNRYGRMVHEYFDDLIANAQALGIARQSALHSRADAEAYVKFVRERIHEAFGPWPEKTPLKPRISGLVARDQYTIEKVTFESRPEFFVTANLYVPKDRKFPSPGVVGSCGHSNNGKAAEAYQSFAQGLARQGYVVLIFDPIGQGERFQYPDEGLTKSTIGAGVLEHLHGGNQQFLVGEFFGSWRAWDGIRALDYLLSRPEVDPRHVGITGNSGGGTMTMWLCGVEQRWTMAAPSCAVTTFRRNFQNELPADTEQCPPKVLAFGLEHGDFLAAMAPKPVIIMGQEKDFFDVRGSAETYERLRSLYRLLGAEENIQLHIGPDPHGYTQANREAMYGFFNQQTKVAQGSREPNLVIEKDETLLVMPRGQVAEINSRTVLDFTRDKSTTLAASRPKHDAASLTKVLPSLLKLPQPVTAPPDYRILRGSSGRQYPLKFHTTYAVQTEPGIETLVTRLYPDSHISRPTRGSERCTLYVSHHSADAELRSEAWLADLIKVDPAVPFYACDVRGIGESKPDTCGGAATFLTPYGCDYFYAAHGVMLDRPYPGQRTWDVLRTLDWLVAQGHSHVHLVARQWGAIPATFAAVLHSAVRQVTLKHALTSYQAVAEAEHYDWPLSSFVPNILATCDLPDCYQALAAKGLTQIEPYGAETKS